VQIVSKVPTPGEYLDCWLTLALLTLSKPAILDFRKSQSRAGFSHFI